MGTKASTVAMFVSMGNTVGMCGCMGTTMGMFGCMGNTVGCCVALVTLWDVGLHG